MAATPKLSSCIILTRAASDGALQLFWAKRQQALSFLGGFYAFLGGGVEPTDEQLAPGMALAQLVGCAARELFEEAGVLWTTQGMVLASQDDAWLATRQALTQGQSDALALALRAQGQRLDASRYRPIGRWTTPDWAPKRFETEFFQVHLTAEEASALDALAQHIQAQELELAEWVSARDALERVARGQAIVSPPTLAYLHHLAQAPEARQQPLDQDDVHDPLVHHWLAPQTSMVALRSPTLPPATHTHCYVIAGARGFIVLDPGGAKPEDLARLARVIDAWIARGLTFEAIVLTHHHLDHVCGAPWLTQRYGAPIWAHPQTTARVEPAIARATARALQDGDRLDLGQRQLLVCWTPGHAPGHLALWDERSGGCFAADLVASYGTILIRPPDGQMHLYLESLTRVRTLLQDRADAILYPAHGWLITRPIEHLDHYIKHRWAREAMVYEALGARGAQAASPQDLVDAVYPEVPQATQALAAMSLHAHLEHLVRRGLAAQVSPGRYLALSDPTLA